MIELGSKVKDPITGLTGIAVARAVWLHGCARIHVQRQGFDKDGKPFDIIGFDEPQLEVLQEKKVKKGSEKTGGPKPELTRKKDLHK